VKDTADVVAKLPECTGKVAVLGFCLGGLITFLTAVCYDVDAAGILAAWRQNLPAGTRCMFLLTLFDMVSLQRQTSGITEERR
jgi:Dienelactone hydrolase family